MKRIKNLALINIVFSLFLLALMGLAEWDAKNRRHAVEREAQLLLEAVQMERLSCGDLPSA